MELTEEEVRVLGCLIEKQHTTPDQYPLSTNALMNACNQKSSREPVVSYREVTVTQTMKDLRFNGYARTITGGRADKHRHILDEALGLSHAELAVLAVMMLRGPQSAGELLTRTDRLHEFGGADDVISTLDGLLHAEEPLVTNIGRRPGQRDDRYAHLLCGTVRTVDPGPERATYEADTMVPAPSTRTDRVAELEDEVQSLRSDLELLRDQFDRLCSELGTQV